jgi:hypothetical protein
MRTSKLKCSANEGGNHEATAYCEAEEHRMVDINNRHGVLRVGDGRGFIIDAGHHRHVITAAHCLPELPLADPGCYTEEKTYQRLLGPLDEEPTVWAECLFADPISDVAVLGEPDGQVFFDESDAYEALVDSLEPFPVTAVPFYSLPNLPLLADRNAPASQAWLLPLEGPWFPCKVRNKGRWLHLSEAAQYIQGGMSGSPILDDSGAAIGLVSITSGGNIDKHTEGLSPALEASLPGWLLERVNHQAAGAPTGG